jgi:hypothetical protein
VFSLDDLAGGWALSLCQAVHFSAPRKGREEATEMTKGRWALVIGTVCLVVAVVAVAYAAGKATSAVPDVIRARRFELVDEGGRTRAVMQTWRPSGESTRTTLELLDGRGYTLAELRLDTEGQGRVTSYLRLGGGGDETGTRAELVSGVGGPYLAMTETGAGEDVVAVPGTQGETIRVPHEVSSMRLQADSLKVSDATGHSATLGRMRLGNEGTGGVGYRPASSLVLSDREGKVVWKAP